MPQRECQIGGRFSRCHSAAVNVCQYCGRHFCGIHTHHAEGLDAVCAREKCQAKFQDLLAHNEYTSRVNQRNHAGLCGMEDCGPHPRFECSLCHGHFCSRHLMERMYPFNEGLVSIDRPVSICQRCWERRKIWRRR